ncbi:hypothetical protein QJS04_geneDACA007471 [Acorus gramineus]|uniref:Beta-carotene isomerase D27-like C-terminal domain-containing protein n=1 Tax=Acorus gramineus TaxID=55184 RepID=A0AAV9B3T7_ACOGR|nr:hypothetical protein QJS04_geneDACA007471 [Acorus gramineus]
MTSPAKCPAKTAEPVTVYDDNWFDRLAIHHLSQSVQAATGIKNKKKGYESLIEAATMVAKSFDQKQQQMLVTEALKKAFPKLILSMASPLSYFREIQYFNLCGLQFQIRVLLPPSMFSRHYFAIFTTIFFPWLIGPCEVKESEFEGRREKNVVYIKKCRFLEGTNCVGMCTNLCMMPSQKFIKDSFGMPVNMVPNFEDMSCEMIFGQNPPEAADDPALKQPCYRMLCKPKQKHGMHCSSG